MELEGREEKRIKRMTIIIYIYLSYKYIFIYLCLLIATDFYSFFSIKIIPNLVPVSSIFSKPHPLQHCYYNKYITRIIISNIHSFSWVQHDFISLMSPIRWVSFSSLITNLEGQNTLHMSENHGKTCQTYIHVENRKAQWRSIKFQNHYKISSSN